MATNTDLKIAIDTAIAASVKRDGLGTHPDVCRDIFRIILKENEGAKGIKFQAERIFACRTPARMREYKAQKAANAALQELAGKLGMSNYNPTDNTYTKNVPNSYLWKLTQLANRVIGSAVIAADTQKVREFIRLGADITDSSVVDPILLTFVMRQTPESRSIETALPMAKAAILANDVQGMTLAGYVSRHVPLTSPLYREVVGKAAVDITPLPVSIMTLPDDCLHSILLQLPLADALRSRQLSRTFNTLVHNDEFYLQLLRKDLPHYKPMSPTWMPYQKQYHMARKLKEHPLPPGLVKLLGGQEAVDKLPVFALANRHLNPVGSSIDRFGPVEQPFRYIVAGDLAAPIMRGLWRNKPFIVFGTREEGARPTTTILFESGDSDVCWHSYPHMPQTKIDFSAYPDLLKLLSKSLSSEVRLLNTQELQQFEFASLISNYIFFDERAQERAIIRCKELLHAGVDVCACDNGSGRSIATLASQYLPITSDLHRQIAWLAIDPHLVKLLGGQEAVNHLPRLHLRKGEIGFIRADDLTAPVMRGIDKYGHPFVAFCVQKDVPHRKKCPQALVIYQNPLGVWFSESSYKTFPKRIFSGCSGLSDLSELIFRSTDLNPEVAPELRLLTAEEMAALQE